MAADRDNEDNDDDDDEDDDDERSQQIGAQMPQVAPQIRFTLQLPSGIIGSCREDKPQVAA